MTNWILKTELKNALSSLGVSAGQNILVQTPPGSLPIVSGMETLLEVLQDLIGPEGTVIVPAFTLQNLDPACRDCFAYDSFKEVRASMTGFSPAYSLPMHNELALTLLAHKARRTHHPVYSLAFLGQYENSWLETALDYPFSFQNQLQFFLSEDRPACNLLIGLDPQQSLLVEAVGHDKALGLTRVERAAALAKNGRNSAKTYLVNRLNRLEKAECLKDCQIIEQKLYDLSLALVSLNRARPSHVADLSTLLKDQEPKLF